MEPDEPLRKAQAVVVGEGLDSLSVGELEHRIEALEVEILRVRAALAAKRTSLNAAAAFFR